jgi:hypothetical protein
LSQQLATQIMRKETISFQVPRAKTRAHYVLFAEDSPFKPKAVKRKDSYKRKPKHKNSFLEI